MFIEVAEDRSLPSWTLQECYNQVEKPILKKQQKVNDYYFD